MKPAGDSRTSKPSRKPSRHGSSAAIAKPPFTHDIAELLQILSEQSVDPSPYLQFSQFTLLAVQLRYDDEPEPLGLDRQHWLAAVQALLDEVDQRIVNNTNTA